MPTPRPMDHHGCDTCPLWLRDEDHTNGRGTCHKHAPPALSKRRGRDTGAMTPALARWPGTMKDNYCGDHPAHAAQAHAQFAFYLDQLEHAAVVAERDHLDPAALMAAQKRR